MIDEQYRDELNARKAGRKVDRQRIGEALVQICDKAGAKWETHEDRRSITLIAKLKGVGAMIDICNDLGGETSLVSWFNDYSTDRVTRHYSNKFCRCVGARTAARLHHKATSQPSDWYSLAMFLESGLELAKRGEAFAVDTALAAEQ